MRILGIRFKNINSLAGEWQVDFTLPDYTADGIFAITGPTGAGKTTLLDVICLALYGRTPRLERVNKSGNDVMTRQTGECFAEVTFSTPAGTFRCHWSQHRARKKADGDLQTPKHEISDADSGQIIDNQIRTVEKRIEETTGMDFQRFTQSMMLAQGGFAAFLKASADERAPILEQITGTGIYSDISVKVHERHVLERNQLHMLQRELSGIQLLTPEQESALTTEESIRANELLQQQTELNQLRQHYDWKRQCLKLEQNFIELNARLELWQQQHDAFTPQREQLEKANHALALSAHYSTLAALRQNQQEDQQRVLRAEEAEPELMQSVASRQNCHRQAETARQQAENSLAAMRPVFKRVHVLDSKISQQRAQLERSQAELSRCGVETGTVQQQTSNLQAAVDQGQQSLSGLLQKGETDYSSIVKRLTDECEQKQLLLDAKQSAIDALAQGKSQSHWRQYNDRLSAKLTQCDVLSQRYQERGTLQEKLQSRQHQLRELSAELGTLSDKQTQFSDLAAAREALTQSLKKEAALLQTIKSMESHRALLNDDQPCPLCGALDHPYANHTPDADVEGINNKIREADRLLAEACDQHQQISHRKLQLQEKINHQNAQQEEELQSLNLLEKKVEALLQDLDLAADKTLEQYRTDLLGEQQTIRQSLNQIESEQLELAVLNKAARDAQEKLTALKQSVATLAHSQQRLQDSRQQLERLLIKQRAAQAECESQQNMLSKLLEQRHQLLGDKNADQQEVLLETELSKASAALQSALAQYQLAQKQLDENHLQRASLTQQISERAEKISKAETAFLTQLQNKGFNSEADFQAASLSDNARQQLQHQADQLQQHGTGLQAQISQTSTELKTLLKQALSTEPLDTLQQAMTEQDKRVSVTQEALGGIRRDLSNNEQARSKQRLQAEKIDAQKSELERWAALHELIGSADGKKFRNFAQGLTFELMISHANQQLAKMTDRYLLLRDKGQPLDLNVIDHYQAGEIRSTKNLSGGESFIVSLALALGLSRMASRNVRVDSLFLDEGFGTLDEDALDTALETLASLQQEGKLIGVISHVPALKERISTQIRVSPGVGGRSTLSGPGCSAL